MKAIALTRSILTTLPVIGLAAALTLVAPSDARANHQWKNASGVGYHWKRVDVDPLVLRIQDNHDFYVSENYTVDWPAIFQTVIANWSESNQIPPTVGGYGGLYLARIIHDS